jgi:hypothetical protein
VKRAEVVSADVERAVAVDETRPAALGELAPKPEICAKTL